MPAEKSVQEMFNELLEGFYRFEKNVSSKFDQVNKRFDQVNKRFDQVDEKFDQINTKIDKLEEKTDKNSRKLNTIENEFRTFKKLVMQYSLEIEYLKDKLEDVTHS